MSEKNYRGEKKSPRVFAEAAVTCILIVLIILMLIIYFSFRETGDAPKFFGYYIYHTHATNMGTNVPAESAVFAKETDIDTIDAGDVILCRLNGRMTIIRVSAVLPEEEGKFFITHYDLSPEVTYKIPAESVVAMAVYYDDLTGKILNFATSEKGIIIVVIIPSILIVLFQVIKIILAQRDSYEDDEEEEENDSGIPILPVPENNFPLKKKDGGDPFPELPPVRAKFDTSAADKTESVLKIDEKGAAVYEPEKHNGNPLITEESLDIMRGKVNEENLSSIESFVNETVKIPEPEEDKNPFSELLEGSLGERGYSSFKSSNVIPDELTSVRTTAAAESSKASRFASAKTEQQPKEYFSMTESVPETPPKEEDMVIINTNSIPENSVLPQEKIAPVRKSGSNKTIEELMSIIDAEQAKIKNRK